MATNDENRSRVDRNRARDKNKSPIQSEIDTTLNTFSFNVTQAKDDAKKIYQNLSNQHKTYLGTVEKSTKATYTRMYKDLSHQHSQYLTNLVNREKAAHDKIAQIWGGAANIPNNDSDTSSPSLDNKEENEGESNKKVTKKLDIITTVVEKYFEKLIDSADQFVTAYTQNYNKYTTAFNTNYKGLTTIISSSIDQLDSSIGSRAYNITKDLLPALEKVASTGLQGSNAITKAADDVIASKIMPYLETQSATWTNLYANLSESSIQTLKGQQLLLKQTEAGSRLLQSGVINSLTDELEPLLRDIEYNTSARDMGEYQGLMEQLVSEGGMTEREAYDIVKTAVSASKHPFAAITSGSLASTLAGIDVARGGSGLVGLAQAYGLAESATTNLGVSTVGNVAGLNLPADTTQIASRINKSFDTFTRNTQDAKAFYNKQVSQIEDVVHNTDKLNNSVENLGAKTLGMWTKDIAQPITNLLWMIFGAIMSGKGVSLLGKSIGIPGLGKGAEASSSKGSITKALLGSKLIGGSATTGALSSVAAGAGVLAGIYTAYDGIKDFAGSQSGAAGEGTKTRGVLKAGGALGGAAIGAAIGAVGGPIGLGVGTLAGAVIGQVAAAFYDAPYEKTLERVDKLSQGISDLGKAADAQNTIKSLTDSYESLTDEQKIQLQVLKETYAMQQVAEEQVQEFAGSSTLGKDWNLAKSAYYSAKEAYGKAYRSGDSTKISEAEQQLSSALSTLHTFGNIYKNAQYLTASQIENVYKQIGDLSSNPDEDLELLGVSRSDLSAWSDWMDSRAEGYKGRFGGKGNSYAVGSDYITHDQVATIHEGEMVLTKADSALLRTIGQNASSTMSTYYSNQNKSSTEIVDTIKWAVDQLLSAISSSVSTTSNGNGSLDVKLPGSIGYNDNMISMVRWAMA